MPRKKGESSQAVRCLQLHKLLAGYRPGFSLAELQERFGITRRQLDADLEALHKTYRIRRTQEEGRYGKTRVRLSDTEPLSVALSSQERLALVAARSILASWCDGTALMRNIDNVLHRIDAQLPPEEQRRTKRIAKRVLHIPRGGTRGYARKAEIFDCLLEAVVRGRLVRFTYRSPNAKTDTTAVLAPFGLVLHDNGAYIRGAKIVGLEASVTHATGAMFDSVRTYAFERFGRCEIVQGSSFEDASESHLANEFSDSFGIITSKKPPTKVTLQFSGRVRSRIEERTWHRSQELRKLEDGSIELSLEVPSLRECLGWVLGWTSDIRVLEPAELRDALRIAYSEGLALCSDPSTGPWPVEDERLKRHDLRALPGTS